MNSLSFFGKEGKKVGWVVTTIYRVTKERFRDS